MGARKTEAEQDREKRKAELERLADLYLRLVGFDSARIRSLQDLDEHLQRIRESLKTASSHRLSVPEMLDLLDTDKATRELVCEMPELVLRDEADAARLLIWDYIIKTKSEMLRSRGGS